MSSRKKISDRVTSSEIRAAARIKDTKTLTRWHRRGLIPKPEIGTHPNGRGKIAYWPRWVLDRCERIRHLVQAGKSLDEVALLLGDDWGKEEKVFSRRYRMSEVSPRIDLDNASQIFATLVTGSFAELLRPRLKELRPLMSRLEKLLLRDENITAVIDGINRGCNLVLLFDGNDFQIAPDFVAGQILAEAAESGQAYVMKSLYRDALTAFAKVAPNALAQPLLKPSAHVTESTPRGLIEYDLHRIGLTDSELVEREITGRKLAVREIAAINEPVADGQDRVPRNIRLRQKGN